MCYNHRMSDQSPKIITTFQNRLEIATALRSLGDTDNEFALRQRAREIAEKYGEQVIAPLLTLLDTPDPQLRGGLGQVATLLDRDKILSALRGAAYNHSLSDQARIAAITILERFLQVEPDPAMYAGMAAPEELAMQSLHEVLVEAQANRLILIEYFKQLSQEPPDVLLTMVRGAKRLEGPDGVEMLRLFAQDPQRPVAEEALQALGSRSEPLAVNALQTLLPNLPPALRVQAERSLQKLQLRGVPAASLQPLPCSARCLAGAPDAQGNQTIWFVLPNPEPDTSAVLQLLISGEQGLVQTAGSLTTANAALPPTLTIGQVHNDLGAEGQLGAFLLEAPFDYGRRQIAAALRHNWDKEAPLPLPYRLLNPWLWQWEAPAPAELPDPPDPIPENTSQLLRHPALNVWYVVTKEIYEAAEDILTAQQEASPQDVERMIVKLLESLAMDTGHIEAISVHLLALREWLYLAGDQEAADQAYAAAAAIVHDPIKQPILAQLVVQGLRVAMVAIARGLRWNQMRE